MRNLLLFVSLLLLPAALWAKETTYKYEVSWMGITAGKIKIQVREGKDLVYLYARSKTVGLARLLYPLEATWQTWATKEGYPLRSRIYRKKGDKELTKEFFFDQKKGVVRRVKNGKVKTYVLEHKPVYDELSAFWVTMRLDFQKVGETKTLWIYAHKKANSAQITYLKDEELKTIFGKVKAKKLKVEFGFESELVKRAKKAYLWVYQGKVVKSEGDLPIGHLTGTLKEIKEE